MYGFTYPNYTMQGYGSAYGVYGQGQGQGQAAPQSPAPGGVQGRSSDGDQGYGGIRGQGAVQGRVDRSYRPY